MKKEEKWKSGRGGNRNGAGRPKGSKSSNNTTSFTALCTEEEKLQLAEFLENFRENNKRIKEEEKWKSGRGGNRNGAGRPKGSKSSNNTTRFYARCTEAEKIQLTEFLENFRENNKQ